MASLPRSELLKLVTTRYVSKKEDFEREELETARAGSSLVHPQRSIHDEDVIEGQGEDVELVEENYRAVHRIDETPKLIAKQPAVPIFRDEAVKVLRNLQKTPAATLRAERFDYFSQRWFHTSRESEKNLVEYVLLHPNQRPYFFTMQCRQVHIEDLPHFILTSLLTEPRETGQCLARFAIQTKPEMSFKTLYGLLEEMVRVNEGFELSDEIITASITPPGTNRKNVSRFQTKNCKEYGELEPELDQQGKLMASSATIACSVKGKRHVQVQITYKNNSSARSESTRCKYIELEQIVKCMNRRILIMEEKNELVEFEIEKDMISLKEGVPPVYDLISFLRSCESDDEYSD